MRRLIVLFVLAILFAIGAPAFGQTYLAADEAHIEQLVNGTRASKGVAPLAHQAGLQGMARAQAVRMMQKGNIYHNPNLSADITALGVDWRMVGENVGMGPDADTIEDALLKSPHHYENIVRSNFNYIGVGIVHGGEGHMYLVQVFAQIVAKQAPVLPAVAPRPAPAIHVAAAAAKPAGAPTVAPTARPAPHPTVVRSRDPEPNALMGGVVANDSPPMSFAANHKPTPGGGGPLAVLGHLVRSMTVWA